MDVIYCTLYHYCTHFTYEYIVRYPLGHLNEQHILIAVFVIHF